MSEMEATPPKIHKSFIISGFSMSEITVGEMVMPCKLLQMINNSLVVKCF